MKKLHLILAFVFYLIGCSTVPYTKPNIPGSMPISGFYHRVEKGQTLWRISKMYGVDLDELVQANRISTTDTIEIGQRIIIPRRFKPVTTSIKYSNNDDFAWPLRGKIIANFGQTYNNMLNKGINIQPYSSFDIIAAQSGKVVFYSNDFASLGKTIIIEHSDRISSVYARNSEVYVRPGDIVSKGSVIAKVGSSGRDKNTYLHFEIRKGANSQNPLFYLP